MLIYISSTSLVDEVSRGIWHFYKWIEKQYDFQVIKIEKGTRQNCYNSILLESHDKALERLQGTLLWQSQSPFRPAHRRKNWYFALTCYEGFESIDFDHTCITYQSMKSPKKGGQHVNTTNSGIRALYPPLGISAVSFDQRSQHQNRQIAYKRLEEKYRSHHIQRIASQIQERWQNAKAIKRGDPIKTFYGEKFKER
ncbi:MAG: peptide chain release factor H [Epsilonproteobacteria bacterium]|nr:peptide chain release factor H [Campylobacterota bacterium]